MRSRAISGKSSRVQRLIEYWIFSRQMQRILPFCFSLFFILGCLGDPKPTTFAKGEKIPLGSNTVTVSYVELTKIYQPCVAVHLECIGPDFEQLFVQSNFRRSFAICENYGQKYPSNVVIPASVYRVQKTMEEADFRSSESMLGQTVMEQHLISRPRDWVIIFYRPHSYNLTLLIENPNPLKDQPRLAAVPLGW